jgi:hypothetical protein
MIKSSSDPQVDQLEMKAKEAAQRAKEARFTALAPDPDNAENVALLQSDNNGEQGGSSGNNNVVASTATQSPPQSPRVSLDGTPSNNGHESGNDDDDSDGSGLNENDELPTMSFHINPDFDLPMTTFADNSAGIEQESLIPHSASKSDLKKSPSKVKFGDETGQSLTEV